MSDGVIDFLQSLAITLIGLAQIVHLHSHRRYLDRR